MRKVFDFIDIRKLENTTLSDELKNSTIVTATSDLARAIKAYYPDYDVHDVHKIITTMISEWEKNIKDIKNYVMLRNIIEDYVTDNDISEETATYLRRNTGDMWNAIKLLIEADIYPDDMGDMKSLPVKHFKAIWRDFEVKNEQIVAFRSILAFELTNREAIVERFKTKNLNLNPTIVLIGFYFITPIQDRIFDILEKAGFKFFKEEYYEPTGLMHPSYLYNLN